MSFQLKCGRKPDPVSVRDALLESATPCDPHVGGNCGRFLAGTLSLSGAFEQLFGEKLHDVPNLETETDEVSHLQLRSGDMAPEFELRDHNNASIRLQDFRGQKVLLWFYPQADTPD